MFAVPPLPRAATTRVTALEPPSSPASILATRLDLAEGEDALETAASTIVTSYRSLTAISDERSRVRITHSRHADLSAGEIFNRIFGVLTVAAD
jgi:hypothetical protein